MLLEITNDQKVPLISKKGAPSGKNNELKI